MNTITTDFIADCAYSMPASSLKTLKNELKNALVKRFSCLATFLLIAATLTACSTPQPPTLKTVYDFGPMLNAPLQNTSQNASSYATLSVILSATTSATPSTTRTAAIALPEIEASGSLQSPALLYRLQYSNPQELRPYTQARWSVPPAQLVRERIRDALSLHSPVLSAEGSAPFTLRIELEEFSHLFESPDKSQGILRLRASLYKGAQLTAQTTFATRADAPSQDAAGGVKALTAAADDVAKQLADWVGQRK